MKAIKVLAKRSLAVVLAVMMAMGMLNLNAFAATPDALTNAAQNGGTYTLESDITVDSTIDVTADFTLNLNGYTVKFAEGSTGSVFHVKSGTFTLNGPGTITGGKGTVIKADDNTNEDAGWHEIVTKDVSNNTHPFDNILTGGAVLVEKGATFTMNGGTIDHNSAERGGGIAVARGGKLNIYGGSITNNTATTQEGGGIFCAGDGLINPTKGDIMITGNETGTVDSLGGGGIFIESKGTMKIYNAEITSNDAEGQGGGVAGCLHGKVTNISPQTAAIYGNKAYGRASVTRLNIIDYSKFWLNNDLAKNKPAKDYFCAGYSVIGSTSMNGGSATWSGWKSKDVVRNDKKVITSAGVTSASGNPIVVDGFVGLSVENPEDIETAANTFKGNKVKITGNTSSMHGGGIGCNGTLSFGEESFDYATTNITINASKNVTGAQGNDGAKNGYTFQLLKGNDVIAEATSDGDGIIQFPAINSAALFGTETKSGTLTATLKVKEVVPSSKKTGMTYDEAERTITITVNRTKTTTNSVSTGSGGLDVTTNIYSDKITGVTVTKGGVAVPGGASFDDTSVTLKDAANFTNEMKYGKLTLTKIVSNNEYYKSGDTFSFNVTIGGVSQTVTLPDAEGSWSWTSGDIPVGTKYSVTETNKNQNGYSYKDGEVKDGTIDVNNDLNKVEITNKRDVANLTVKKVVDINDSSVRPSDLDTKDFTIVVRLGGIDDSKGTFITDTEWNGAGVYTFTLKRNGTATITGIPTGTSYEVWENGVPEWTEGATGYTRKGIVTTTGNGALDKDGETEVVTVTNHYYEAKYTPVTVEKEWKGDYPYLPVSVTVRLLRNGQSFTIDGQDTTVTLTKDANGKFTHTWDNLPLYEKDDPNTGYKYTVEEISVNYGTVLPSGWKADNDGKPVGGLIRVRTDKHTAGENPDYEIAGGWRVSDTDYVKDGTDSTITLTNTWVPAVDLGTAKLIVHKIDSEHPEEDHIITNVEFTLTGDNYSQSRWTNDGNAVFEGLKAGTYTLTETDYLLEANAYNKPSNYTRTWKVEIVKDTLIEVTEIDDKATSHSNGDKVVGENDWSWKPEVSGSGIYKQDGNTVTITNDIIRGRISVTKLLKLDGVDVDENDYRYYAGHTFTFELHAAGKIAGTNYTAGSLVDTLTIEAGETGYFENVRYGKYYIVEVSDPQLTDYVWEDVTFSGDGTVSQDGRRIDVEVKTQDVVNAEVEATNSYTRKTGGLQVSKTVAGDQGSYNRSWHFTVTLTSNVPYVDLVKDGEVNDAYTYVITGDGENADVSFVAAGSNSIKAVITLKHGQTAIISGIPVGVRYTVTEDDEARQDGYSTTSSNTTGIITETLETAYPNAHFTNSKWSTGLSVEKKWVGDDNVVRPDSIDVVLYRNGVPYETVTLNEGNEWSHHWSDLDNVYTWTVGEYEVPEGYDSEITRPGVGSTVWTITNTYTRSLTTDVTVNKAWVRDNAETRPEGVWVQLYRGNETYGEPVLLNAGNEWSYTWEDLSTHDEWSVLELDVPAGYDVTYSTSETEDGIVLTITNTGSVEVSVVKEWDDEDDADGIRPDYVTVQLYRGNFLHDEVTLDETNDWSYTWTDLPLGYDYTVREVGVPEGYEVSYEQDGDVWTITNTHVPDEEFDIIEDDVPLAPGIPQGPDEVFEIPEDDVPLASVPQTGDESRSWGFFAMISGIGLALMALFRKKQEDSAEEE